MSIIVTSQFQRTVDFSTLIDNEDGINGPMKTALCNLPVGLNVQKWIGMGEDTAILVADTEDEVNEMVTDLISAFELMSKCVKYFADGSIEGVDFNQARDYASSQYENITAYGGTSNLTNIAAVLESEFPNNIALSEEEDETIGEHLVYFYWDKEVHLNERGEIEEVYQEDYPLNSKAQELGIEDECYGEIIQLPLSVAQQYFEIELEDAA